MLRPTPAGAGHAIDTACYPLLPFANRIDRGRFTWNGREQRITLNALPQPHALHGIGWERAWAVATTGADHARLTLDHGGDARWPFAFHAEQHVRLDEHGLSVTLAAENRADEPAPMGLGFHPFFPASGDARLATRAEGVWLKDGYLPASHAPADAVADLAGNRLASELIGTDHCFTGWSGEAVAGRVRLVATGLRFLHVYVPEGETFFCAEPVSHMPNAINRPEAAEITGLRTLAPGGRMEVGLRIRSA